MFGVSFGEMVLIAVVALVVVGPRRLPEYLGKLGQWVARLRRVTTEVRRQTGIDEILRAEGLAGGIQELRSMMRGDLVGAGRFVPGAQGVVPAGPPGAVVDPYGDALEFDRWREYPVEGPDAYGAIPEDLAVGEPTTPAQAASSPMPSLIVRDTAAAAPAPSPESKEPS